MTLRLPARLRGRGPALWLTLGAVAVGATAAISIAYAGGQAPAANRPTTVRVQRGAVELTSSAAGTVQMANSRGLSFSTGGVVTEIDVKPGDSVTAGQVLARIDSTGVQNEVDTAQASVNSASDALARAQQTTPPASCQVAPAVFLLDPAGPSATPSASASPAPTATASAAPSPSHQSQGQPVKSAQPSSGSRTGTGSCGGGTTTGRSGSGDSLMSAEQQLTNAQLALRLAQDKLSGTTITAPVAGKVLSVAGTVGAQESPGGSGFIVLGEVADTAVRAEFSEADVAHLAIGQTATITLPNRGGAEFRGKVSQIDPAGTVSARLVRYGVMITFDEVPPDLLLGQSANVAVITASATDALYVPSTGVSSVDSGNGTVAVRSGTHDERRTVRIGLRGDQYTEIRSGLQEGDEVVVGGAA
jgi:multidrug efflux pump subunit AcrA (membrane-fusion protein)